MAKTLRATADMAGDARHSSLGESMAMTAAQMVDFFREQAEMSWAGVEGARQSGDYDLAAFNTSGAYDAELMAGLIQWRLNEDPRQVLARACGVVRNGLASLEGLKPGASHWLFVDFSTVSFIELLLGQAVPHSPEPDLSEWGVHGLDYVGQFLDRALAGAIRNREEPPRWGELLASLASRRRLGLLQETHSTYREVITSRASGDVDGALRAASRAVSLFRKRESDSYYAGGREIDGGGPDNPNVVDFRLAAILKHRLPEAASFFSVEDRVHLWSW